MRDATLYRDNYLTINRKTFVILTFDRKKRTRAAGSRGIRPETVNDLVLAAINLETLVRRACSPS